MANRNRRRRRSRRRGTKRPSCAEHPGIRRLRLEPLEERRMLSVVTVDTDQDVVDFDDGVTSLREAIFATNLVGGADEIQFDFDHDGPATILLTQGELKITDDLTITGTGAELLTIDASGNDPTPDENNGDGSRVFRIDDGDSLAIIDVRLRGLTLTGGDERRVDGGGAIKSEENISIVDSIISGNSAGFGGAVYASAGTTTIVTGSAIWGNSANFGGGGGIWSHATTITDSSISANSASSGGGISAGGSTTISGSTFMGNLADHDGGGISISSHVETAFIIGSTISDNSAGSDGGGISARSVIEIRDSTVSNNQSAGAGGGIFISSSVNRTNKIVNSTITDNTSNGSGGGLYASLRRGIFSTQVVRSNIANNTSTSHRGGGIFAEGNITVVASSVSNNMAGEAGGGIFAEDDLTIITSTIAENVAHGPGGGVALEGSLEMRGSTISHNEAIREGGGIYFHDINSINNDDAKLNIVDTVVSENETPAEGGGIYTSVETKIADSQIINNHSTHDDGGGIYTEAETTITDTTISENSSILGGGIFSDGKLDVTRSTIAGNFARRGGAILAHDLLTLSSSTISGNSATDFVAGVYADGDVSISHATITANSGNSNLEGAVGTGLYISASSYTASLDHVVLAGNLGRQGDLQFIGGIALDLRYSIIGDNRNDRGTILPEAPPGSPDANGNLIGGPNHGTIDPLLNDLADNGGPTLTHALLPGSPAINAGDLNAMAGVDGIAEYDQRGDGFDRIFSRIDIGAYEVQELGDLNLLVDTLKDESDGDYNRGDLSLREAIELANANPGADTIRFDPIFTAIASLLPATILLTMGELDISDSVEIIGLGADLLTIDASGNDPTPDSTPLDDDHSDDGDGSRVFNIRDVEYGPNELLDVSINSLSITGGDVDGVGGAIRSLENLMINTSKIFANSATADGGGLWLDGVSTITDTIVEENISQGNGGAIRAFSFAKTTITESVIARNWAGDSGGGLYSIRIGKTSIYNSSIVYNHAVERGGGLALLVDESTIFGSTIRDNTANLGGGVYFSDARNTHIDKSSFDSNRANIGGGVYVARYSDLGLYNSQIVDNLAEENGGGIYSEGRELAITGSTISGNSASKNGGGILISNNPIAMTHITGSTITNNLADFDKSGSGSGGGMFVVDGSATLDHSIVAGNLDNSGLAPDIAGIFNSNYSLIGLGAEFLGPLADNGGPTLTHALLPGSPAIDAGDPALQQGNNGLPEFDQRGAPFGRVVGSRIDIGAFEVQPTSGSLHADFDDDGDSDGSDFLVWQRKQGATSGATQADGDATGDGDVDGNDLAVWEAAFGNAEFGLGIAEFPVIEPERAFATSSLAMAAAGALVESLVADGHGASAAGQMRPSNSVIPKFAENIETPFASSVATDTATIQRWQEGLTEDAKSDRSTRPLFRPFEGHDTLTDLTAVDEVFDQF